MILPPASSKSPRIASAVRPLTATSHTASTAILIPLPLPAATFDTLPLLTGSSQADFVINRILNVPETNRRTSVLRGASPWWRLATLLVAIAAILMFAACGDDSDTAEPLLGETTPPAGAWATARDAARNIIDLQDKGQWGPQWDRLHPAQQALVPRELFVECATKTFAGQGGRYQDAKVLETFDEEVGVPGTDARGPSTAVTVEYTYAGQARKQTLHYFEVAPRDWRWAIADIEPFKAGQCP